MEFSVATVTITCGTGCAGLVVFVAGLGLVRQALLTWHFPNLRGWVLRLEFVVGQPLLPPELFKKLFVTFEFVLSGIKK